MKALRSSFDKVDGYFRRYDSTNYLALFYSDERLFERNRYLLMLKSNISDVCCHKNVKTKIIADDDLPLEKTLNLHN